MIGWMSMMPVFSLHVEVTAAMHETQRGPAPAFSDQLQGRIQTRTRSEASSRRIAQTEIFYPWIYTIVVNFFNERHVFSLSNGLHAIQYLERSPSSVKAAPPCSESAFLAMESH